MRERGLWVTGIVVCLLLAGAAAGIDTDRFDLEGELAFPRNGDLSILQDEVCDPIAGWSGIDPNVVDEETPSAYSSYARADNYTCAASSSAAPGCWTPPVDGSNPIRYTVPVCGPAAGGPITETSTYFVSGSVWFDSPRNDASNGASPCAPMQQGDDTYLLREQQTHTLGDTEHGGVHRLDPPGSGCSGGDDISCLVQQDLEECAGGLVIEYVETCPANAGELLCPGNPFYPRRGQVSVRVADTTRLQAVSEIRSMRQTRLPVRAGQCTGAGCAPVDPACGDIVLACDFDDPECDFTGSLPPCMDPATWQYATRVDVFYELGSDPYDNLLRFGRRLTNVPIACNAVTRVRLEVKCPTFPKSHLQGRFQVLGYEDEVLYCSVQKTPHVTVADGPSTATRSGIVSSLPDSTAHCPDPGSGFPGFATHNFLLQNVQKSDQVSIEGDDKNYSGWASFVLTSPEGLDELVLSTAPLKGRGPDLEPFDPDFAPPPAPFERDSTGYSLFRTCAAPPPPHPLLVAHTDAEGDWLYFTQPDYT